MGVTDNNLPDQIGDGRPAGQTLGADDSQLAGCYGKATAQYANIAVVTNSLTSGGITAGYDSIVAKVNSLIASQTLFGIVAAS